MTPKQIHAMGVNIPTELHDCLTSGRDLDEHIFEAITGSEYVFKPYKARLVYREASTWEQHTANWQIDMEGGADSTEERDRQRAYHILAERLRDQLQAQALELHQLVEGHILDTMPEDEQADAIAALDELLGDFEL